jgi:transposase-like protein
MITNSQAWHAFDKLALINNVSVSGLARLSGLDATTFNKSKRTFSSGKERWPSMCTVAKVLNALHMTMIDFAKLFSDDDKSQRTA